LFFYRKIAVLIIKIIKISALSPTPIKHWRAESNMKGIERCNIICIPIFPETPNWRE
jgi:hypothetical protein